MKVHPPSCTGRREAASLLGQQKVLRAAWLGKTWGIPGCYCSTFCTETRAVTAAISVSSVQQTTCPMCGNPGCSCTSFCQLFISQSKKNTAFVVTISVLQGSSGKLQMYCKVISKHSSKQQRCNLRQLVQLC
jgi:hypothetical protein